MSARNLRAIRTLDADVFFPAPPMCTACADENLGDEPAVLVVNGVPLCEPCAVFDIGLPARLSQ